MGVLLLICLLLEWVNSGQNPNMIAPTHQYQTKIIKMCKQWAQNRFRKRKWHSKTNSPTDLTLSILKKKTKLGGGYTFQGSLLNSLPPLPHGLEALQPVQEHICFYQSIGHVGSSHTEVQDVPKPVRKALHNHPWLSLLPRHCNPIRTAGNSHACFSEGGRRRTNGEQAASFS